MKNSAKTVLGISSVILALVLAMTVMSSCNLPIPNANNAATISAEDAKTAAFSHAEVSPDDATRFRSKLDFDDGRRVYEIEFDTGEYEFDYEIDAETGEIVKFDKEKKQGFLD